jgi:hypothetical protein
MRSVLARSSPVSSFIPRDHVQPGDTEFTRMRSPAKSIARLRVSCASAALDTG